MRLRLGGPKTVSFHALHSRFSLSTLCVAQTSAHSECSPRSVPFHPLTLAALLEWKKELLCKTDANFLFPSIGSTIKRRLARTAF